MRRLGRTGDSRASPSPGTSDLLESHKMKPFYYNLIFIACNINLEFFFFLKYIFRFYYYYCSRIEFYIPMYIFLVTVSYDILAIVCINLPCVSECKCVCVCACVRACVHACVRAYV